MKNYRYGLALIGVALASVVTFPSCNSNYPIDVCRCSKIEQSNSYQISLVDKKSSVVLLTPAVELVRRISPDTVILSNLKSQTLIENPKDRGNEFWDADSELMKEGYFLHQCGKTPMFVSLGMDREKAIALALDLMKQDK